MNKKTLTSLALAVLVGFPIACFSQEEPADQKGIIEDTLRAGGDKYIPEAAKWVYKNSIERGVIGVSWDHYGATNVAAALKLNKKGPVYALLGAETLAQGKIDKLLERNPNAGRLRLFAAPALDFMWVYNGLGKIGWVNNLELLKLPESWHFIAGPQVNLPVSGLKDWTWKTHTRIFVAFTAKGG